MSRVRAIRAMSLFVTQPLGARSFVVALVEKAYLRITHVADVAEARVVKAEWERGDFSRNSGRIVALAHGA